MSNDARGGGSLIVVSAPSGTGKTTLTRLVLKRLPAARFSVSHTTRPPRGAEQNGVDYHFVDDAEFDRMIAAGELAEWAEYQGRRYGTSNAQIAAAAAEGADLFLDIEGQGGMQVKEQHPDAVLVFVLPPSREEQERRLRGRGVDAPEAIARRLANARREAEFARRYDYIIVNDELEDAACSLESIVRAARQRREKMHDAIARFAPAEKS
jgi:guanylate kinase